MNEGEGTGILILISRFELPGMGKNYNQYKAQKPVTGRPKRVCWVCPLVSRAFELSSGRIDCFLSEYQILHCNSFNSPFVYFRLFSIFTEKTVDATTRQLKLPTYKRAHTTNPFRTSCDCFLSFIVIIIFAHSR